MTTLTPEFATPPPMGHTAYCTNCAHPNSALAPNCTACGHPLAGGRVKSKTVTLLLWFFLGPWGAHRFYLGDGWRGAAMPVSLILSTTFAILSAADGSEAAVGWTLVVTGVLLWVLVDGIVLACRGPEFYRAKARTE